MAALMLQSLAAEFINDLDRAFPYIWGFFLAYMIGSPLMEADNRRYCLQIYSKVRARHLAANLGVAALTILGYFLLSRLLPVLNISWVSVVASGSMSGASGGTNALVAPIMLPVFGPVFALLLLANFPLLTHAEERLFRAGTKSYLSAIPRSLTFGLVHCLVGVPVAAGLALAIPGMWFSHHYINGDKRAPTELLYESRGGTLFMLPLVKRFQRRTIIEEGEGMERATLNHTCYNALLICLVGAVFIVALLG